MQAYAVARALFGRVRLVVQARVYIALVGISDSHSFKLDPSTLRQHAVQKVSCRLLDDQIRGWCILHQLTDLIPQHKSR